MDSIEREQIDEEYNQLSASDKFFSHPLYVFCFIVCSIVDLYWFANGWWVCILLYVMFIPGIYTIINDGSLRKSIRYYFY
jgi:hypothetical protein